MAATRYTNLLRDSFEPKRPVCVAIGKWMDVVSSTFILIFFPVKKIRW